MKSSAYISLLSLSSAALGALFLTTPVQGANLVQYWPLENYGAATATNAVPGGNPALIVNQDTNTAWINSALAVPLTSRSAAAVYLDGATPVGMFQDYLDLGALRLNGAGTISLWINPGSIPGDMRLISPVTDPGQYSGIVRFDPYGTGKILVGGWNMPQNLPLAPISSVAVGAWSHLAAVYVGGSCTLYVNGTAVGTNYSGFNFDTVRLGLGAKQPSASGWMTLNGAYTFNGDIDDVSVWDGPVSTNTIALLAAGVLPTAITDGPSPPPPAARLVQYYPLEENAGSATAANLAGSNPAYLTNFDTGVCWVTNSVTVTNIALQLTNSTTALACNGNDSFLNLGVMGLMGKGTISLWINSSSNSGTRCVYSQIDGGTAAQPGRAVVDANGQLRVGVGVTTFTTSLSASGTVPTNRWEHIAMVYDGIYVTAYVNGVRQGSTPTLLGLSTAQLGIGAPLVLTRTYGTNWWGLIDDISIWDGPLSSGSIQQLAAGVCPTNIVDVPEQAPALTLAIQTLAAAQLTQYWPLEGSSGDTTAANLAPGGNVGQLFCTNYAAAWITNGLAQGISNRSTAAMFFDGVTNFLYVGTNNFGSASTPSGAISFWLNPAQLVSDRRLFGQTNAGSTIGFTGLTAAGQIWDYDSVASFGGGTVFPGPAYNSVSTNHWSHLVFNYENGFTTLYVDGIKQQSVRCGFTAVPLGFGNKTRLTLGQPYSGLMDDISIWNHSLSPASITQLAAGTVPTGIVESPSRNLLVSWPAAGAVTLESAPSILGPWQRVAEAVNPVLVGTAGNTKQTVYLNYDPATPARYFRLRR